MIRLAIIFLSISLLAGCSQEKPTLSKKTSSATPSNRIELSDAEVQQANLKFATAEVRHLPQRLDLAATVQPDETRTMPVSSLVPGRVEQVLVHLGDFVKQGQILATIRSEEIATIQSDFLQKLLELRAEEKQRLLELAAEAKQLETKIDYLQKQYQRKKFLQENKIGAKAELESAQSDLLQAEAALEAARAKEKAAIEAAAAKEQALVVGSKEKLKLHGLSSTEIDRVAAQRTVKSVFQIRAPAAGLITSREIDPGETTDANNHLFVITDLSSVWLIGQIFEKDLRRLVLGMAVSCTVESYPDQQFRGQLEYLGAKLDPQTRTLPIRASVRNDGQKLRPDMFGHIHITVGHETSITVPKEALQIVGETQVVFVRRNQQFVRRTVKTGNEIDNFVEITDGLKAGEQVVTTGSIDLLGKTLQSLKQ